MCRGLTAPRGARPLKIHYGSGGRDPPSDRRPGIGEVKEGCEVDARAAESLSADLADWQQSFRTDTEISAKGLAPTFREGIFAVQRVSPKNNQGVAISQDIYPLSTLMSVIFRLSGPRSRTCHLWFRRN